MNMKERRSLERLLRGVGHERVPEDLLESLRKEIPNDVRAVDPDDSRSERYFSRLNPWLAAASLVMIFTFTFLITRVTFLEAGREPDLNALLERQAPERTKVSESAADETPIGAAARKRPPDAAEEAADSAEATVGSAVPSPATQRAAVPASGTTTVARASRQDEPQVSATRERVAPASPELHRADAGAREEMYASAPSSNRAPGEDTVVAEAPSAPPPPSIVAPARETAAALKSSAALAAIRPVVLHRERSSRPLALPAEIRVSFTIDGSGKVIAADVTSPIEGSIRSPLDEILRRWTFEPGAVRSFELLVNTDDLQPLPVE